MPSTWMTALRIVRFDLAAAAIGSSWLMLWLAGAVEPAARVNPAIGRLGQAWSVLLAAVMAGGLAGGYLWMPHATRAAMAMLLAAAAAALGFGQASAALVLLVAAGIVLHSIVGRYVPAVGIVTLGLMWAAGMAVVNPMLGFGHPIALAMTHVMGCAVLLHLYSRRRPRLGSESAVLVGVGWAFWVLLGVSLIGQRRQTITVGGEHALIWVGPTLALFIWIALAARLVRHRAAAQRIARAATLWLLIYAAGWLAGAARPWHALAIALLAAVAWVLERWRERQLDAADADARLQPMAMQ